MIEQNANIAWRGQPEYQDKEKKGAKLSFTARKPKGIYKQ